ncbi:unnamed protein product [Musa acuminata var. zebrina]
MLVAFNAYRRAGGRSMNSEHHQPMNHHYLVQPPTCHQQGADSREGHQTSSEFAVSKEDYLFRNEYFSLSMNLFLWFHLLIPAFIWCIFFSMFTFMRVSISNDYSILSHPIGYNPIAWRLMTRIMVHITYSLEIIGRPKDYNSLEAAKTNKSTARAIQKSRIGWCGTKFLVDSSSGRFPQ